MNQVSFGRRGVRTGALCLAALLAVAAPAALADTAGIDPDFRSDQRGFVPSTGLAGEGNVQVETGVAGLQDGTGSASLDAWSTPTVLRFGMPSNYEVRLQSAAYSHVRTPSTVNSGMSDLMVGIKTIVPQSYAHQVSLAALIQATFPSGSSQIKSNGVRPEFQLIGEWRLPNATSIGGVAGMRSDVDVNDNRYPTGVLGMNLNHTWSERFDTYAEFTGREIRTAQYGGKNMVWGLGGAWHALPSTQINASVGWGLKDNDTDTAWAIGITQRFRPPTPGALTHKHSPKTDETPSASTEDGH
jgi:hypothetical protein